jgi:hypothetical protein
MMTGPGGREGVAVSGNAVWRAAAGPGRPVWRRGSYRDAAAADRAAVRLTEDLESKGYRLAAGPARFEGGADEPFDDAVRAALGPWDPPPDP